MKRSFKILIYSILAICMAYFTVTALFKRAVYNRFLYDDFPILPDQNPVMLVFTSLGILAGYLLLVKVVKWLNRFDEKYVVPTILICSVVIQIAFLFAFPFLPYADQEDVNKIALEMLQGDYSAFQKYGYLYMYPNNVGVTLYLALLYSFDPGNLFLPKFMNVVLTTGMFFIMYLIYRELSHMENSKKNLKERDYGILLVACLFLPSIFLNNHVYNDVISASLFTCMVYFTIRFVRTQRISPLLLSSLFLTLGNFLRPLGPIFLIAAILYLVLNVKSLKKTVIAILILTIPLNLPMLAFKTIAQASGITKEPLGDNAVPVSAWLNIGMTKFTLGYWDGAESIIIYKKQADWNKQLSEELFKQEIREKIDQEGITGILKTYGKKVFWVWTEGTYQSEYIGMGMHKYGGFQYETAATQFMQDGSRYREYLRWFLHCLNYLMIVILLGYLLVSIKKRQFKDEFLILVILGFIGFYTFWEIKPRYLYVCAPFLLILFYSGLKALTAKVDVYLDKLRPKSNSTNFGR